MAITGLHHLTLRVTDVDASADFYEQVLALPLRRVEVLGEQRARIDLPATTVWVRPALPGTPAGDRFDERRIGMDHVAVGVDDHADLEVLLERLRAAGVPTQGVQPSPAPAEFVCFRDPDNVQWEFYRLLP